MILLLLIPIGISGQTVTAAISGTVTDAQESVVPGAHVTVTDTERGTTFTTESNAQGFYNLPAIPIGSYTLKAEAKGFQTSVHPAFELQINQSLKLDVKLQVGNVEQTVQVTTEAPLLQSQSTQLATVIDSKATKDLPLATRNYVQLTLLAPGTTNPNPQSLTTVQTPAGAGRPYVNGNREQEDNFLLDGMDNNQASDNLVGYNPSVDAIQEFREITSNAPAEYGNFMGAIVSSAIRSGTNQLHGDLFEFLRNDKLNAAPWQNGFTPGSVKPKLRWNMYGGTLGGPIAKNKLFFFVDYQAQRFHIPSASATTSVMDAAMRAGDFGELCTGGFDASGICNKDGKGKTLGVQLIDPHTKAPIPYNNIATYNKTAAKPLPEDPVAAAILNDASVYPLPNLSAPGTGQNYQYFTRSFTDVDQGDFKLDYNPTSNDTMFARFSDSSGNNPSLNTFQLLGNGFNYTWTRNGVADWAHVFSPAVINDMRVGVNYVKIYTGTNWAGEGNLATKVGMANANPVPGLPSMNISGGAGYSIGGAGVTQLFADTTIQYDDGMTITSGRHVMHAGFQYYRTRLDTYYSGNPGQLGIVGFNGNFSGAGAADFWMGMPVNASRGGINGTWGQRANQIAGYFQDDWSPTDGLTLNLGLRYDNHTPWVEVHDRQVNFDLYTGKPINPTGSNRGLYNSYNLGWDFQPRFGFAWTPAFLGGKTVVRGAWTVSSYLEGTGTNLRLTQNPPFSAGYSATFDGTTATANALANASVATVGPDPYINGDLRAWDPNVMPAISNQYSLTIQRQIGQRDVVQIGYVGQKNTHLMVPMNYAQFRLVNGVAQPGLYLGEQATAASMANGGTPSGIFQIPNATGDGALPASPGYDAATVRGTASNGNQRYDSLQAVLQHRFDNNLSYQVSYTFSKCMTDSSGYYGSWGGQTNPANAYWQDIYNSKAEWGPCFYDVTHTLTSYAVYSLPIGHGRAIGKNWNGITDSVLGGWQLSGILTLHGGFALTTYDWGSSNAYGNAGLGSLRGTCTGPIKYVDTPATSENGVQWFDGSTITTTPANAWGNCGVGNIRGPGMSELDMSLQKHFKLGENRDLEFRGEAINFTNTPIFNSPSTTAGDPNIGVITSAQGARQIQFALKLTF